MAERIPASEQTHQRLTDLLERGVADGDARAELIKLAVRKIVEEALEAEVTDALGREYYANGATPGRGYRNGYRRGRLKTAEGAIDYGVPQVADRAEPFVSRIRAGLTGRTAELEDLAVEMYAKSNGAAVIAWYTEVESGKLADRPELAKALSHARRSKGTLVVAKLDRLARNVAFLSALMDSKVPFVACDNPHANRLTLLIDDLLLLLRHSRIGRYTPIALRKKCPQRFLI